MIDTDNHYPLPAEANFSLAGHNALVTGGGSHLGFAMASALARQGASITVLGRHRESLTSACERLTALAPDGDHHAIVGDLLHDDVFDEVAGREDFDLLINNAGGAPYDGYWQDQTPEEWRLTLELNVIAPNRLCQIVAPHMQARGTGRIINVASIFGVVAPDPRGRTEGFEGAAYTTAKHAVVGLTQFLAAKLGPSGITANVISPGRIPIPDGSPDRIGREDVLPPADMLARWADQTPLRRNGLARDLAGAVVFLASPASDFVTGHNLVVDGGWTAW